MRPVGLVTPPSLLPGGPTRPGPPAALPRLTSAQEITRAVIQNTVRDAVFTLPPYGDPHTAALLRRFIDQGSAIWLAGAAAAREGRTPHADTDRPVGLRLPAAGDRPAAARRPGQAGAGPRAGRPGAGWWRPAAAGCALAVRLGDGPGVLFRQERIGRDGRRFTLLKFRTRRAGDAHEAATRGNVADDAPSMSGGSAASCAAPRWTSCHSCGTCCAAT